MQFRSLALIVLLTVVGGFAWLMVWGSPEPRPTHSGGAEQPVADAVGPAPSPSAAPPAPTPTPAPAPVAPAHEVAPAAEAPEPTAMPVPPPLDPRRVLQLPAHVQDAPPEEQRAYYEKLLNHHESMLAFARKTLGDMERAERSPAELAQMRKGIEDAEAQIVILQEHLRAN